MEVVRKTARAHEVDRYLAALLAPRAHRDALIAIAAFAGEIGRIPVFVSEPMMGRIRLQWWRDALDRAAEGAVTGHPVADRLAELFGRGLSPADLAPALDAVERELDPAPAGSLEEACAHADRFEGTLMRAAAACLGGEPAAVLTAAAQAYGLARRLNEAPRLAEQGRHLLAGIEDEAAETALRLHGEAKTALRTSGPAVRLAALPVALAPGYVRLARRRLEAPSRTPDDLLPLTRVSRLWAAARLGRW